MTGATMTSQLIDQLMDAGDEFEAIAVGDQQLSTAELGMKVVLKRAMVKALRIDGSHRWVKNILNNAEINATVERRESELARDVAVLEAEIARLETIIADMDSANEQVISIDEFKSRKQLIRLDDYRPEPKHIA